MQIGDTTRIYTLLTSRKPQFSIPLERTEKEWNPYQHKVMDARIRKKKIVKTPTDQIDPRTGERIYKEKKIERCRIAIPIQQVLVRRTADFLFSNPVEYKATGAQDANTQKLVDGVSKVFRDNKMKYFDKKLARTIFREREAAELWYFVLDEQGHPTKEMRVKLLSPLNGDALYPHFDDYGRMDGFARKYTVWNEEGENEVRFDVYTSKLVYRYKLSSGILEEDGVAMPHGFDKIPVIYYRQEEAEWTTVQPIIERVEELLSNWGDTNDYFGTPSYFVHGSINGFAEKGEQGRVYQGSTDSDMKVLSWDNSPESVRGELANLLNIIFSYTQTPDISFENMRTLGSNTSGVAIRLMFTDPHMKANNKIELFGEMFTRRFNVVANGYVKVVEPIPESVLDKVEAEPVFSPYIPKNEYELLQMIQMSNGGKASLSRKDSVEKNPLVINPQETLDEIEKEEQQGMMADIFSAAGGQIPGMNTENQE